MVKILGQEHGLYYLNNIATGSYFLYCGEQILTIITYHDNIYPYSVFIAFTPNNLKGSLAMSSLQIADETSANEALRAVVVGNTVRITFKADVGKKFQQRPLLQLQHKLEFDTIWLAAAHNRHAIYGNWGDVPRVQDFKITRMSDADREIFAHALADITESIEVL
jgi:hypothetical protein